MFPLKPKKKRKEKFKLLLALHSHYSPPTTHTTDLILDMAGEAISKTSLPHYHPHDDANPPPPKKKRNLPGTPDPEAEVIALSPKSLLATNRFLCEICGKGFQRDQNLQLHRRGHNLPWKLRQRSSKEPRKRVYVCPEKSCVHHNPSRALGDLTGIKKHFCRKHGEKKWKCEKCSKRYAVQSDWKAHAKTCGTREYRCDCGTLFSRRDSFITHRAFCDALAEESARISAASNISTVTTDLSHPTPLLKPTPNLSLWMSSASMHVFTDAVHSTSPNLTSNSMPVQNMHHSLLRSAPSLYSSQHQTPRPIPDMSATALLQKAAQIGVTSATDASLFAGFGGGGSRLLEVDMERYDGLMASLAPIPNCLVQSCFNSGLENSGSEFSTLEQLEMEGGKTRDFLGVRFQPLCPSSIQGWM